MRSFTPKFLLFCLALAAALFARAGETDVLAAVRAADDVRIAATIAADATRLDAILSDELHYAHSSGVIDSKASLLESLTSHRMVYESVEHVVRDFVSAGPGLVLMRGRMLVRVGSATQRNLIDLNYLAVWREEGGRWRFLAWQSSRNPAPAKP
jgi:Domain of unknown function (DUF4440)